MSKKVKKKVAKDEPVEKPTSVKEELKNIT